MVDINYIKQLQIKKRMNLNETITITYNRSLFEAHWDILMKFQGAKRKRQLFFIGWFSILLLIGLLTELSLTNPLMIIIVVYLVYVLYSYFTAKQRWVNSMMKTKIAHQEVQDTFTDDYLLSISPYSESKTKWNYFINVYEDKNGFLVAQDNQYHMYFPKSAFPSEEAYQRVLNKFFDEV